MEHPQQPSQGNEAAFTILKDALEQDGVGAKTAGRLTDGVLTVHRRKSDANLFKLLI
jgi:hypothetical protein